MNTIKIDKKNALMVSHMGLAGLETMNTIPGFVAAGNRSYYGIETDMHVTRDGKFVIIHDDKTGRVAESDIVVEDSSLDLLRKINLIDKHIPELGTRQDLIPPTVEEYVRICKWYEKKCVLEIKNPCKEEDIARLVEEIRQMDYLEHVVFISFALDNMIALRKLLPEYQMQYLTKEYSPEVLEILDKYNFDLDIRFVSLTKEVVDEVHAHGHKVNVWVCDNKEEAEQYAEWGVDFITTNILE